MRQGLVLLLMMVLVGCTSGLAVNYKPIGMPVKLTVQVDHRGQVSVGAVASSPTFSTFIGTFDFDVTTSYELRQKGPTLIVIVEDTEWVYQIESDNVSIDFDSQEYCRVGVELIDDDVIVRAARHGSSQCSSARVIEERVVVVTATSAPSNPSSPSSSASSSNQPQVSQPAPPAPTRSCDIELHAAFRSGWSATGGADVSCPTRAAESYQGGIQYYDHGVMIWVPPTSQEAAMVYVVYNNSNRDWQEYRDNWNESLPETRGNTPPVGKIEPKRGFGLVWLDQLGGPSANIGWAVSQESATTITIQKLNGTGMAIQVDSVVYYMPHGRGWVN